MAYTTSDAVFFCTLILLQVSCTVSQYTNIPAVMTLNGFEEGEGGGGPAACYGYYMNDQDFIVSLSTEWFPGGVRCGKSIRITDSLTMSMNAIVVDECRECDNEVGASPAVWHNFGLHTIAGEVDITWSDLC